MYDTLCTIKGTHRKAIIYKGAYFTGGKIVVSFYYDGDPDYEWKKGSFGVACSVCDTLGQAKKKANYYIKKDKM